MREYLTLSAKEQQRSGVVSRWLAGIITTAEAVVLLGCSERTAWRLRAAMVGGGAAGLAHGNRGRASPRRLPDADRDRVLELARTEYRGYNDTHLAEALAEDEGIAISRPALQRLLRGSGMPSPRTRRGPRYRSRRERMAQAGLLVQVDGSRHDWLEGRGPWLTLVGGIDDATGILVGAVFREQEDGVGYLTMLRDMARRYGLPAALYRDGSSVFAPTGPDGPGRDEATQVGRVLAELGITTILAGSAQAKGRIERAWGTLRTASPRSCAERGLVTCRPRTRCCSRRRSRRLPRPALLGCRSPRGSFPPARRMRLAATRPRVGVARARNAHRDACRLELVELVEPTTFARFMPNAGSRPARYAGSRTRVDARRLVRAQTSQPRSPSSSDARRERLMTEALGVGEGPVASPVIVPHLTDAERAAKGRAAREAVPRSSHGAFTAAADREPVRILEEQGISRVAELLPIRYGRMLASAFTFYRGAAAVMAADLSTTPRTSLKVQLCGDAHLANFGGFASPERTLVFDINDFDETLPGPFEWDVKRLAASFEVAGRDRNFSVADRRTAVLAVIRSYREAMLNFAPMDLLEVWYSRLDVDALAGSLRSQVDKKRAKAAGQVVAKARSKDSMRALGKLTRVVDGQPRIISDPPLIVPIHELLPGQAGADQEATLRDLLRVYRSSLQHDRRRLLEQFRYADLARKVVGVGSVGTRAWIMLLFAKDESDPLFLQAKEAQASVLEPYLGRSEFRNHGRRVVEGQRMMQASSDIFLGWVRVPQGIDGAARDFYVRQLWDWKVAVDLDAILPRGLALYAQACGWTLARAHARSGDRIAIAAYLGSNDAFDRAIGDFAIAYADQNERDHAALRQAADSGRIQAQEGT